MSETVYDGRGLPWKETTGTDADQRTRLREFDPNGNLRRLVSPKGVTDGEAARVDSGSDVEADRFHQGEIGALVKSLEAFQSAGPPYPGFVHWLRWGSSLDSQT